MRMMNALAARLLLLAAVMLAGCSKFAGEWVETGAVTRDGTFVESAGPRRLALKFEPVATVRAGSYVNDAGVVDHQAVTYATYLTMQKGNVAQFGATIAKIEGNRLVTYVGAEESRHYVRHRGPSIFPPRVYARSTETGP